MQPDLQGLRVLIVGNWPAPIGGVSIHVRALRDAARKAGATVRVLDIGQGQNTADGVVASGGELLFATRLVNELRQADLVHLHTSGANPKSLLVTAGVGLAARAAKVPAVVTFHSGHGPHYLQTASRAVFARYALASYSRVVCVSEEISETLQRIGAAERRHLVAPAFGLEGVTPGELPPRVRTFVKGRKPVVSAMLAPGKDYGARELFTAFAALHSAQPKAALVVYGPGTDWRETELLATKSGAGPVLRLGQIERGEALALMQASDLFVRPTLVDGDAVSVREGLALGIRVVATTVGHRPRGVTLCAPGDADSLARALKESLAKTPGRPQIEDGIVTVLQLYSRVARPGRPHSEAA